VQLDFWQEYTEQMDDAIALYVRTGSLINKPDPFSPNFSVRSHQKPVAEISESKLFGDEDESWPEDKSKPLSGSAASQAEEGVDLYDWTIRDDSDLESWLESDGVDTSDETDTGIFTEKEHPIQKYRVD
jgi:hypothetical protein